MPSLRYSFSLSGLILTKGNTATPAPGGAGNDVLFQIITPTVAANASDNPTSSPVVEFRCNHFLPRLATRTGRHRTCSFSNQGTNAHGTPARRGRPGLV